MNRPKHSQEKRPRPINPANEKQEEPLDSPKMAKIIKVTDHEQSNLHDSEQSEDDDEVENLRMQYIAIIEKTNVKLVTKEEELTSNNIKRDGLKNILKKKQYIEKRDFDFECHQEITEMEQEIAEQEKKLAMTKGRFTRKTEKRRKENEEIRKKHRDETTALDMQIQKDQFDDESAVAKLKEKTNKLAIDLGNFLQDPTDDNGSKDKNNLDAARATLECPICMEMMKPPTKIWMCCSSHIVCQPCRGKLKGLWCPTCRNKKVNLRAHLAEHFARTVFDDDNAERKIQKSVEKNKEIVHNGVEDGKKGRRNSMFPNTRHLSDEKKHGEANARSTQNPESEV